MKALLVGGLLVIVTACFSACASGDAPVTGEALVPAGESVAAPAAKKPHGPMPRGGLMDDELNFGKTY